jgi:hypothetical protein
MASLICSALLGEVPAETAHCSTGVPGADEQASEGVPYVLITGLLRHRTLVPSEWGVSAAGDSPTSREAGEPLSLEGVLILEPMTDGVRSAGGSRSGREEGESVSMTKTPIGVSTSVGVVGRGGFGPDGDVGKDGSRIRDASMEGGSGEAAVITVCG